MIACMNFYWPTRKRWAGVLATVHPLPAEALNGSLLLGLLKLRRQLFVRRERVLLPERSSCPDRIEGVI